MPHAASPLVRVTVIQNSPHADLGAWADWPGVRTRVVAAHAGEPLPEVADLGDGLLVLGGLPAHADEDAAPWLPALRALLASAIDADVPTLGIGFGAQVLATVAGGRVQADAPPGLEAGATAIYWRADAATDPVLAPVVALSDRGRSMTVSMHADAIVDLPERAPWLGSSNQYPFQAFRVGSALGLQFHPEATRESLAGWCARTEGVDEAAVLARFDEHAEAITGTGAAVARGFAAAVLLAGDGEGA